MIPGSKIRALFLVALAGGAVAFAQSGVVGTGSADPNYAQDKSVQVQVDGAETTASQDQSAVNAAGGQHGDSHVRIVRLSDVRGTVKMDRTTGQGLEQAIQNMPIVEKGKIETSTDALASVEFEDQSTMGLVPESLVEFPQLVRRESGGTATTVKLVRGTMYVNLQGTKGNTFVVQAGENNVTVMPGTRLRLETNPAGAGMLSVFSGSAQVQGAAGAEITVAKKESLTLGGTTVAKNVEKSPYDEWNKQETEYQERYAKANSFAGSSGYGVSDLNYYGSFVDMPGCGMMWQPYFVSAAWDPYQTGLWAYYPGAGYSWVSPYPWGWLPFHSGQWANCGGAGWGWRPGGAFYGLQNTALVPGGGGVPVGAGVLPAGARPVHTGPVVPRPVQAGQSLVLSTKGPITASRMEGEGFVFEKNSAGLGIPRGQLGSLNKISNEVGHNGAMSMPVDVRAVTHNANAGAGAHAPVMIKPAGTPEVHGNSTAYRGGREGMAGNPNTTGGGGNGSAQHNNSGSSGGPPHGANSAGGPPPAPHSAGGAGYGGGGGGGHMGGGGAPLPPPPPPPPAAASSSSGAGASHK
jgi:FecR protein